MLSRFRSSGVDVWCLWAAFLLAAAAALVPVVAVGGGTNRIAGVALPLAIGAVVIAVNALTRGRNVWLSAVLYAASALAILYGLILALSVPLRLAVEGVCQPAPAPCPLGFDRPMTSPESIAVTAVCVLGALSLLFTFVAAEIVYLRRPKPPAAIPPPARKTPPPTPSESVPTPEDQPKTGS